MKKRIVATLLAVVTCTAMLGTSVFAAEIDGASEAGKATEVPGITTVEPTVYSVIIPSNVVVSIDPFQQLDQTVYKGGQVVSGEIAMINKSSVPVDVFVDLNVVAKTGVNVVEDEDSVGNNPTDKDIYLGVILPTSIATAVDGTPDNLLDTGKAMATAVTDKNKDTNTVFYKDEATATAILKTKGITYEAGTAAATQDKVVIGAATWASDTKDSISTTIDPINGTSLEFALDAAKYYTYYPDTTTKTKVFSSVASTNAATSYQIKGTVSNKANWQDDDVKVNATYTFYGLSTTDYGSVAYQDHAKSTTLVSTATAPTIESSSKGVITITGGTGSWAVDKITSVTIEGYDIFNPDPTGAHNGSTYDSTANTITLGTDIQGWYTEDQEAVVTYATRSGAIKTVNVTIKIK